MPRRASAVVQAFGPGGVEFVVVLVALEALEVGRVEGVEQLVEGLGAGTAAARSCRRAVWPAGRAA